MAQLAASPLGEKGAILRAPDGATPRPPQGQTDAEVLAAFDHHAPDAAQIERITDVRLACKHAGAVVLRVCPPSADRSAAIRLLREAMMTANASIALEPGTPSAPARAER